jgi:antitoxin component HigA of HigAB toxin-antitoxin module
LDTEKPDQETSIDLRYAQLLLAARPAVIETPEEHERLLSEAERLMEKGNGLAPEEVKLLSLLVFLIEAYEAGLDEDESDDEPGGNADLPEPCETLQRLMQARKLELSDVEHVFGNGHLAREVLAGKRPISRGQARELAKFFQVPAKLFF